MASHGQVEFVILDEQMFSFVVYTSVDAATVTVNGVVQSGVSGQTSKNPAILERMAFTDSTF